MSRRLRIAIVSQNPVLPLDNGGKIRNFHLFGALARRHDATLLLTEAPDAADVARLEAEGLRVVALPKPPGRGRYLAYLRQVARGAPLDFAVQANPAVVAWLERHASEIDAVVVGSIGPTVNLPASLRRPVIIDTQNIDSARRDSELASSPPLRRRLELRAFTAGIARFERRALRAATRVYVCSADEVRALARDGHRHVAVAPNGVDLERIAATPEPESADLVAFTGDLSYRPNIDAARWMAAEIAPAIRRRAPGVRLLAAGRDAGQDLRGELAAAGVEVRSPVPDMLDVVREAAVVIVPLTSGGGTRLKILEAFGAGRPVVSTRLGAEGIAAEHGRHLLIADDAEGIAEATARLLADPALRAGLAREARALVEREYGWRAIGDALAQDVEAVLAR
ncbi:MAG: glycosyltransferase family 4 protein [Thermoleophilia bacterium]